jgi:hypothetical protein
LQPAGAYDGRLGRLGVHPVWQILLAFTNSRRVA